MVLGDSVLEESATLSGLHGEFLIQVYLESQVDQNDRRTVETKQP